MRLCQSLLIKGPRKPDGKTPDERWLGMGSLNCSDCEARSPGLDSELKRQRGCHRWGLTYIAGEGDPLARWKVDHTGDPAVDYCLFCPASLGDPLVQGWIYEAIDIEHPLGGLDRVAKRPIYHLPSRVIAFYKAALAARDRFDREISDTKVELLQG